MKEKAIVLEVGKRSCTVLTADGGFRKIGAAGNFRPGQEITLPAEAHGFNKYSLAAACLLFLVVTAVFWKYWITPAVAGYVSMDINPSVELSLDKKDNVIGLKPLNDNGRDLIAGINVKGENVQEAVENLIDEAIAKKYITDGKQSVVMAAVTPEGEVNISGVEQLVKDSIEKSLQGKKVKAEVVVGDVTPEIRASALKAGISAGRYMLYLDALDRGINADTVYYKDKSIEDIISEQKIDAVGIFEGRGKAARPEQSGGQNKGPHSEDSARDGEKPAHPAQNTGNVPDVPVNRHISSKGAAVDQKASVKNNAEKDDVKEDGQNKEKEKKTAGVQSGVKGNDSPASMARPSHGDPEKGLREPGGKDSRAGNDGHLY